MLNSADEVIRCLVTCTDWWQPSSAWMVKVKQRRGNHHSDGFRVGLVDSLGERAELTRRLRYISESDRHLLFLWYVEYRQVEDISRILGISRRQCFRRRARIIRDLVELGAEQAVASP